MFRLRFLLFFFCAFAHPVSAQFVSHGPVLGAMGPDSVRIYLRMHSAGPFSIEYAPDSTFAGFLSATGSTLATRDSSGIISLTGLQPNTRYWYRVRVAGSLDARRGQFKTFPLPGTPGNYRILFGSCQERRRPGPDNVLKGTTRDAPVYRNVVARDAHLFIHLGDWAYPNNDWCTPDTCIPYTREMPLIEDAYRERYSAENYPNQQLALAHVPFDFIWDDCDYLDGGSGGNWVHIKQTTFRDSCVTVPAINRRNTTEAYTRYFPHYSLVDTAFGIYHAYRLGNIEVIVMDLKTNMSCFTDGIDYLPDTTITYTEPATGRTVLGDVQKQWLKDRLLNSTADWKVLVSSTPFNKAQNDLLNLALSAQSLSFPGLDITDLCIKLIELWPGYTAERQEILDFVAANNLKNIVVISGDSHTSAIDDGQDGGLPEVMAANLSVNTSDFLSFFANTWNVCRQGGGGVPVVNTIGLLESFGADSMRLVLLDSNNVEICQHTLLNSALSRNPILSPKARAYPNPARTSLTLEWPTPDRNTPIEVHFMDALGRSLRSPLLLNASDLPARINTADLPRGLLGLRLQQGPRHAASLLVLD